MTPGDLDELVQAAILAYEAGQQPHFHELEAEAWNRLSCLKRPLSPLQAARLHQMVGLSSVVSRDEIGAKAAFRAAIRASSDLAFSPRLLELDLIRRAVEEARAAPPEPRPALVPPVGTRLYVDGVEALDRPSSRPFLLQVVWLSDGDVHWSGYVPSAAYNLDLSALAPPLPATPVVCPTQEPCPTCPPAEVVREGASPWLGIVALGATALTILPYYMYSDLYIRGTYYEEILPGKPLPSDVKAWGWATVGIGSVAASLDVLFVVDALRHRCGAGPGDHDCGNGSGK